MTMMIGETELLTLPQAAELLGVSVITLQQQARKGVLGATKLGKQWVVTSEAVRQYRDERKGKIGFASPAHPYHGQRPPRIAAKSTLVAEEAAEEIYEQVTAYRCEECQEISEEVSKVRLYECGGCETVFNAEEAGGNRCPDCNKFAAKIAEECCIVCGMGTVEEIECYLIDDELIPIEEHAQVVVRALEAEKSPYLLFKKKQREQDRERRRKERETERALTANDPSLQHQLLFAQECPYRQRGGLITTLFPGPARTLYVVRRSIAKETLDGILYHLEENRWEFLGDVTDKDWRELAGLPTNS